MKFERRCEFLTKIDTLGLRQLRTLRNFLQVKENEESREDKLELIEIVIKGKEAMEKGVERLCKLN